jgi:hypothetical protein
VQDGVSLLLRAFASTRSVTVCRFREPKIFVKQHLQKSIELIIMLFDKSLLVFEGSSEVVMQ